MGRAYTEKEREGIRIKIMEAGLEIFHGDDAKAMNIREVAKRAGISPGGFYSFYPDKESFVLDVMFYREQQKEEKVLEFFSVPSKDPAGQLAELIIKAYLDIWNKINTKQIYRDSMKLITGVTGNKRKVQEREAELFVSNIAGLWKQQGLNIQVDIQGVVGVLTMTGVMILNSDSVPSPYFEDILGDMVRGGIHRYVTAL